MTNDGSDTGTQATSGGYFLAPLLAGNLIKEALEEANIVEPGDSIPAEYSQKGLRSLNRLIASNNIVASTIYAIRTDTVNLVANQGDYTIGKDPDGLAVADFDLPRPSKIENIVLQLQTTPSVLRNPPMTPLTAQQWAQKALTQVYAIPLQYYWDQAYPLSTIHFYPGAGCAYPIEIYSWQMGAQIPNLTTEISYPEGYEDYFLYSLVQRLCNSFGREFPKGAAVLLMQASQRITANNVKPPRMHTDPALSKGGFPTGNWASGWMR